MHILFIRTPRYRWPFHSPSSSFWQPLGMASVAASVREQCEDVTVEILDCPTLKIGWATLPKLIAKKKPTVVCVGEETVSSHEALRLVRVVKDIDPHIITIAGGMFFSYVIKETLTKHPIDYIVRLEGEQTMVELIKMLAQPKHLQHFEHIKGIAYLAQHRVIITKPRAPVHNLDDLPIPAYDLLPMHLYGKDAVTHKDLVAVEHSRSCTAKCNFCVLWRQLGSQQPDGTYQMAYRTKSVSRVVEEIQMLSETYKRKTFCWVDPTFNVSPKWNSEYCTALKEHDIHIDQTAWFRADYTIRDHKNGVLKQLVDTGIKQVQIGLERTDSKDLSALEKTYTLEMLQKAFSILREYPSVLSVATYIYGLPDETPQSLASFYKDLRTIPYDFGLPIPLTPNPGGKYYEDPAYDKLIEIKDYSYYNYINPVMRSKTMSIPSLIRHMCWQELKLRGMQNIISRFNKKNRRTKAIGRLSASKAHVFKSMLKDITINRLFRKYTNYNVKPDWYDR
ncbi:MAG: B12-binding domain-containing radical SAM protein [Candidatus Woesearchaeota archaeon]